MTEDAFNSDSAQLASPIFNRCLMRCGSCALLTTGSSTL